jgi:hypothetical protein
VLRQVAVAPPDRREALVEDEAGRPRRSLVDREEQLPAPSSLWKRLNATPSQSWQRENQPTCGIGALSSAWPPSSRTRATDASMSSVSK